MEWAGRPFGREEAHAAAGRGQEAARPITGAGRAEWPISLREGRIASSACVMWCERREDGGGGC